MNPGSESPDPSGPPASISEVESLLAAVATQENVADAFPTPAPSTPAVQAYDFRNPSLLSPRELRKLRAHQEGFIGSLASRLSSHFRLEITVKLTSLQTLAYKKVAATWANPSHLSLFK